MLAVYSRANLVNKLPLIGTVFGVPHEEFGIIWVRYVARDHYVPTNPKVNHCMIFDCIDILITAQMTALNLEWGITFDEIAISSKDYYILTDNGYELLEEGVDYQVGDIEVEYNNIVYSISQWYEKNDIYRVTQGTNIYIESNIDQWLNADYELNDMTFEKRNPWDVLSDSLRRNGLLACLDDEFISSLLEVKIPTARSGLISRKIFLPTQTEIHNRGNLGHQFEWYVGKNSSDKIKFYDNTILEWWLRHEYTLNLGQYYFVPRGGNSQDSRSLSPEIHGISPCFAIG